jgi:hypothetical protein
MKKLLVIIIFILSFVGSAFSEILKFDCNYYSSKKVDSLKTNLRIIDTENKTFEIFLEGNNNKVEKYTFNIEKLIDPSRIYGMAIINEPFNINFNWKKIGEDHVNAEEYTPEKYTSCYLKPIPVDLNFYKSIYSDYVIDNCKKYVEEGQEMIEHCLVRFQQVEINQMSRKQDKCNSVRDKIERNNARSSSNMGNFLLGMMEGMWEDLACDY